VKKVRELNLPPCVPTLCVGLVLVAAGACGDAEISTNVATGTGPGWTRHTIDHTSRGADGVKLGDLDGDGLLDIVTGWEEGGEVRAYLNPGPAKSREPWPRVTVGKAANVEEAIFADLDGDGRLEVISATEGRTRTVYWHRFTGGRGGELLDSTRWRTDAFPVTVGAQMWMQAAALDLDGEHGAGVSAKGSWWTATRWSWWTAIYTAAMVTTAVPPSAWT
jgi:hypothetical protein